MANEPQSSDPYDAVVADIDAKIAQLQQAKAAILAVRSGQTLQNQASDTGSGQAQPSTITPGMFHGMSIVEAVYEVLFRFLIAALVLGFVVGTIWTFAVAACEQAAMKAVFEYQKASNDKLAFGAPSEIIDAISKRLNRLDMPGWALPIAILLGLYLMGLREVPSLRQDLEKPPAGAYQSHAPQPKQKVP